MNKPLTLIFTVSFYVLLCLGASQAADPSLLYVDVNLGSDSNDGSQEHPWSTINHAAEEVNPGDTVLIADGTYYITENIYITTSGDQVNPITFKGISDGVIIDASGLDGSNYQKRDAIFIDNSNYVIIENIEIKNAYRAGIRVSESDHVIIRDVESHDNGRWGIFTGFSNYLIIENCQCYGSIREHGIYVSNSGDNPIIRGNIVHDNYACGIHMNGDLSMGGDGIISQALVENNIIYNNGVGGGSGINCDGVRDSIIRNNLLYNNHSSGISLYCIDGGDASCNNQIYHNTVIVASDGRWAINLKNGSSQNKIYNNILLNNNPNRGSITTESLNGFQSDYNILTTNYHPVTPDDDDTYPSFSQWQAMGYDQHSYQVNPNQVFIDHLGNDYRLKKDSPALDAGTNQYTYSSDIVGNTRPYGDGCDIGAYEKINTLIQPSDLIYLGAFRLPDTYDSMGWEWAGVEMGALAYYPDGDAGGAIDGFPGSLYGTGHDQLKYISEISIPIPVISITKNPEDLNTAYTIQDFADVLGDRIQGMELPKIGLAYLEMQGDQTTGKIYYCYGQHIQDEERNPSHGWFELDLNNPQVAGDWKIDNQLNYLTTYYLFPISPEWADIYTPGMYLATGRFRDGGQGSQGPSIFAYGPWNQGNPPVSGTELETITLLQYSSVIDPESHVMNDYAHSDEWNGGAWLNSGDCSSVIFIGTKGLGSTWYGYSDGTQWPTSGEGPFPPVPDINPTFYGEELRGWWSDSFQAQILFYDPEDLAAVASGTIQPYEPQPYAVLNIDPYLFNLQDPQQKDRIAAVTYDSERGLLYVLEPLADGDKSIVHVWKIGGSTDQADLSITKSASQEIVVAGQDLLTYTINVVNNGPSTAIDVILQDNSSDLSKLGNLEYSLDNINWSNWSGSLNLGNMACDVTQTIWIRGNILVDALGVIDNSAIISSTTSDSDYSNNTANTITHIVRWGMVVNNRTWELFSTIQEAANNSREGDTLIAYPGIYYENLTIDRPLTIRSSDDGQVTIQSAFIDLPVILINSTGSGSIIQGFNIMGSSNSFGICLNTVDNCLINGNIIRSNFIGIYIINSSDNVINGNLIQNNGWLGIGVDNSTGNTINGSNNINGNVEGLFIVNNSNGNFIIGNNVHNNFNNGINILNSSTGNLISGNTAISSNGSIGVLIRGSDNNIVSDNSIKDNGWAGIVLDHADGNNVTGGNVVSGNLEGFNLTGSTGNTISGNTITGNSNIGVGISNGSNDNFINNNTAISNNNIIGIYLRDSGGNTISGNNIQINSWVGVCLDNANGNIINNSNISGNLEGLYIVNNSNNNNIQDNNVHDNQDTGMYIEGCTSNQITNNSAISGNGVIGILLRNADGNTVNGNTIYGNNFAGIALDNADNNNINELNIISDNQMGLYLVNGSNGNTINNNHIQNNIWAGLVLDTAINTTVYQNNFLNNPLHALAQNGFGNIFYQLSTGNYWSDWASADRRLIMGNEGLYDNYPHITIF